jgi:hypothetical protein
MGFGNYNAMTASLQKRLSSGLQFQASYTYGHALADTGTTLSGSQGFYTRDGTNINSSYSSAAWDIRHNFVAAFNYEIPFGRGKQFGSSLNTVTQVLLGNWQVNGILSLRTGQPFTLRSNGCSMVSEDSNACGPTLASGNPNDAPPGGRRPSEWFNTANFVRVGSLTQAQKLSQGNVGLQSNTGPPTRTLDFSIFKDFPFTERWKLEFRAEGTNIANTPQFWTNNLDSSQQDSNFGKITGTQSGSERHIQFALRLQF